MKQIRKSLAGIVGPENVYDKAEILKAYAEDKSFAARMKPWFVVKPQNTEQVQKLIAWANETKTPLVPVSSGGSHHRGDTVPSVPQSVIVDMTEMKKILNINRQQKIAVVEPGVTYGELQKSLAKEGLTLSTALAPRAEKSVLTSVLEVEPRLNANHQWSYIDPLRCMEVTWGDGNSMFTGEAGGSVKDLEKQWDSQKWQVNGNGPNMFDFIRVPTSAQGSMGIVTWASLKCEVLPQIHKMYIVPSKTLNDLSNFVYRVIRLRFSDELLVVNGSYLAALLGDSAEQVKELIGELPAWAALVGVAGRELLPEERVRAQEQDISEIAQQFGLQMLAALPQVKGDWILQKVIKPSSENYWKETYKGAFQDIFFVTTLDKAPKYIDAMYDMVREAGYPQSDLGIYIQPQHCGTSVHLEFCLPYDSNNKKETERVKKLYIRTSEELSAMGAYFARPYNIWAKLQLNKDAQSYQVLKKLKGIFDPNNIMNTGKLSI